jgi:hypothetical protein
MVENDRAQGLKPRKNLRGDPRRISKKNRKICGTAVSKLHGRAPNPRARKRRGRRLLVFEDHFYDFWKKLRDFRGI